MSKLVFRLGEESLPTIISDEHKVVSPFADILRSAKEKVNSIADQLCDICGDGDNQSSFEKWVNSTPNNIIAFLGDRGAGKTSCMRTLIKDLREEEAERKKRGLQDEIGKWLFANEIDPSFFDENHNVLEILIGSLYGMFKEECSELDRKSQKTLDDLKKIQDKFRKVKAALRYLDDSPDLSEEYEIDALKHLDEGGKIRILLKNLIGDMLNFKKKRFLVIAIDDLDLNIKHSYVMMEYIRKFLIIPNVIIIIAAKYIQLFDSVCLDLTNVYKGLEYRVTHKDILIMAERYLNKIFPLDQRYEMPSVESYMDAELQILAEDGEVLYENQDVKLTVPALIFEKTRYLFYNSSGMPSMVIPRNLRDLRMLVSMLVKMEPYSDKGLNKKAFKEYFFNEWLNIIEPQYRPFVKGLLEEENLAKINRYVIKNLYDFFLSKVETYSELKEDLEKMSDQKRSSMALRERELLRDILDPANSYWNVSIGDAVFVINEVRKSYDTSDVLALLFLIETFYSMKLYETYNGLTAMTDDSGLNIPVEKDTTAPELKIGVRGDMPEYFRLVGGGFFALTGDYFISMPFQSSNSRESRPINGKILLDEIRFVEREYKKIYDSESDPKKRVIPEWLSRRLRLCEFFMLTVKFRETPRTYYGTNIRIANEPLYFKSFGNTAKYLIFDVTMPFVNAIYPEFAYRRFSNNIYTYAKDDKSSLLNKMIRHHFREKDNDAWELMSKAAIRNMEVLEDLTLWLHKNREDGKLTGNSIAAVLQSFFTQFHIPEKVNLNQTGDKTEINTGNTKLNDTEIDEANIPNGKYWVKTYDKIYHSDNKKDNTHNKVPYYYIHYSIISLLADIINELDLPDDNSEVSDENKNTRAKRMDVFNAIFTQNLIFLPQDVYSREEIKEALSPYVSINVIDALIPDNESLSAKELGLSLANIRIYRGYEFDQSLPKDLLSWYNGYMDRLSEEAIGSIIEELDEIEIEISNQKSRRDKESEKLKKYRQDTAQYEKDVIKLEDEMVSLNKDIDEYNNNIEYLTNRLYETPTAKESDRLKKEKDNCQKSLNAAKATLKNIPAKIKLTQSRIEKAQSGSIDSNRQVLELEKEIRGLEIKRQNLVKQRDQFRFRIEHPVRLELKNI